MVTKCRFLLLNFRFKQKKNSGKIIAKRNEMKSSSSRSEIEWGGDVACHLLTMLIEVLFVISFRPLRFVGARARCSALVLSFTFDDAGADASYE